MIDKLIKVAEDAVVDHDMLESTAWEFMLACVMMNLSVQTPAEHIAALQRIKGYVDKKLSGCTVTDNTVH
jgi:hypothetical protein